MALHPAIALAHLEAARLATPRGETPEAWRAQALKIDQQVTLPRMRPAPACEVRDIDVPVPGCAPVRVRIYSPVDRAPQGALLSFFGGAFRQGGVHFPSSDTQNRSRAAKAGVLIAAVDYALAPESAFPAPVEQGRAALNWLMTSASALGFSPDNVAIGGLSAGGSIAAAVALSNRDSGGYGLRFQLLEVPVLDLTGEHLLAEVASDLGLSWPAVKRELLDMGKLYLNGADSRDPRASPLLADNFAGLPPAHVFTAEYDVLRGDGQAYVHALHASGQVGHEHYYAGMTHDSHFFDLVLPEAAAWQRDVIRLLRTLGES